ncbi:MAG: hypothetical protein A3H51_02665, partial [Candidatus Spechtbacteria bacterium RIFCSPLOWO2_02_FULL_38_8]
VYCDLTDFNKTFKLIKNNNIDFIFHLAAQSIVENAIKNPRDTFNSNIMGTVNVLEAARRWGKVSGIIVTSSDKAYGKIRRATEKNAIGGDHPYETSKASADLAAHTYFKTFGLPVIVTRFGNVYGEGDLNFNRIIPGIMKAIIKKKILAIRSDGKFVRDYVYVGNVVNACILLSTNIRKLSGEAFNISSLENLSVLELVDRIGKILNVSIKYQVYNRAVNEIPTQSIDFAKIRKTLGWKPKSSLKTTIPVVYDWYKSYFKNFKKKS